MQLHQQSGIRRALIATQQGEHIHDYGQILIGWQGRMSCELPNTEGALSRGHIALAPEKLPHVFTGHSADCELLVIDVLPQDPILAFIEEQSQVRVRNLFLQSNLMAKMPLAAMPSLEYAASMLASASSATRQRLNTQMLPMIVLQVADAMMEQDALWRQVSHSRLNTTELQRLIDAAPERNLSNEWLAQYFNMSESHFYTVCQAQLGLSPQKYILQRKLQQAQSLLRSSRLPVALIAQRFGFASTSAFSRAYRKTLGHSPAQERGLYLSH